MVRPNRGQQATRLGGARKAPASPGNNPTAVMSWKSAGRPRPPRALVDAGAEFLCKLPPKTRELTRPDSLPDAPHGVKEESQVVVRQEHGREHLAGREEVAQVGAGVAAADGA